MQKLQTFSGVLHFQYPTALLEAEEVLWLLAIDVPLEGHITKKDINAAHNELRKYYGYQDGDSLTVQGFVDGWGSRPLLIMVRVVTETP